MNLVSVFFLYSLALASSHDAPRYHVLHANPWQSEPVFVHDFIEHRPSGPATSQSRNYASYFEDQSEPLPSALSREEGKLVDEANVIHGFHGYYNRNMKKNSESVYWMEAKGAKTVEHRWKRQAAGPDNPTTSAVSPDTTADSMVNPASEANLPPQTATLQSPNNASNSEDQPEPLPSTLSPEDEKLFSNADVIHDYHRYYNSTIEKNTASMYWVDMKGAKQHSTLSRNHRMAAVVDLQFDFPFYGHYVNNVTVATGGFIYVSPFLHEWLTATQYIAPLMANFDPSMSTESHIFYQNMTTGSSKWLVVEWRDVLLKDQHLNKTGKFQFQAHLFSNGSIHFVYKKIPIAVTGISSKRHPVKVGLSDAYYNDTLIRKYNVKRRTIIEYDKVAIDKSAVEEGSSIFLHPLPTCNLLTDCFSCTKHIDVDFNCKWCNTIGRCSDGNDWYRQHWDQRSCGVTHTKDSAVCQSLPTPSHPVHDPHDTDNLLDKCANGKCDKKSDVPVAVVVIIVLLIAAMLAGLGGWVFYAYTHPTSKSGMWLMEHRPSQLKAKIKFWKSSSDSSAKYKAESEA